MSSLRDVDQGEGGMGGCCLSGAVRVVLAPAIGEFRVGTTLASFLRVPAIETARSLRCRSIRPSMSVVPG